MPCVYLPGPAPAVTVANNYPGLQYAYTSALLYSAHRQCSSLAYHVRVLLAWFTMCIYSCPDLQCAQYILLPHFTVCLHPESCPSLSAGIAALT